MNSVLACREATVELIWMPNNDGQFSTASTWDIIRVKAPVVQEMD